MIQVINTFNTFF